MTSAKNRERPGQTVYLHKSRRRDGRVYLTLVEGYREGGRVKHRTVESLGYLDELEREHADPIAHFKQVCDEANAEARAGRQGVQVTIHPQRRIDKRKVARKNIGSAALLAVYGALGVEQVVRNHFKKRRFSFDANAVMRLLVTERILDPGSKKSAWENRGATSSGASSASTTPTARWGRSPRPATRSSRPSTARSTPWACATRPACSTTSPTTTSRSTTPTRAA